MIGFNMSSRDLSKTFTVMNNGNIIYKDYILVTDDDNDNDNIDYYVILNYTTTEKYISYKSIVIQMEPWVYDDTRPWGVKSWGTWAIPNPKEFLHVRRHVDYLNPAQWFFPVPKSISLTNRKNKMIAFLSHKKNDIGHINRISFIQYIESINLDIIDVYGYKNYHDLKSYKGTAPSTEIIQEYKYMLSAENNREYNYATEKIWESFIAITLCFYDGCPNLKDYVPEQSFIPVSLDNQNSLYTILQAINNNAWERSIPYLEQAKSLTIEKYNALNVIHETINNKIL